MRSLTRRTIAITVGLLLGTTLLAPGAVGQDAPVEVSGVEYAFVGLPSSVPVGTSFRLRNEGKEDHEFFVVRRNEGTTETVEELLALPFPEMTAKVTFVGGVAAPVGQTSMATFTIEAEGEYIAVCFITQGTSADAPPAEDPAAAASPGASPGAPGGPPGGPPHAALGMVADFTVGGPDTPQGPLSTPVAGGTSIATPGASPAA